MSQNFNLEDEYGGFLDLLEVYISEVDDEPIEHYGIKGMKWGVRKDRSSNREPLKSLGPDKVVRKTASGETITIEKVPPNKLQEWAGRRSKGWREEYSRQAQVNILDGSGKKVGDAMFQKKNDEELYLEWLGIKKSARGNGYATAVMKAARDFGQHEGFKRMVLEVPETSRDAHHIYSKLGFKAVKGEFSEWGTNMVYEFDAKHAEEGLGIFMSLDKPASPEELLHYGVKGMKWGVRRRQEIHRRITEKSIEKHGKPSPGATFKSGGGTVTSLRGNYKDLKREVKADMKREKSANKAALKDAREFARAKMFYGEGAGTRRKLIKARVDELSKKNPDYKKAFEKHLAAQDMAVHAAKAKRERKQKNVKNSAAKTTRGVSHYLRGNPQYASAAAAMLAGGALWAHKNGVDKAILKAGKTALKSLKNSNNIKPGMSASEFLKNF